MSSVHSPVEKGFSLVDLFRELEDDYTSPQGLIDAISDARLRHYRELPPTYEVADLYRIALENAWLTQIGPRAYRIHIPANEHR